MLQIISHSTPCLTAGQKTVSAEDVVYDHLKKSNTLAGKYWG